MNIPDEVHLKAYTAAQDVPFVDGRGNPINGPVPHSAQIEAAVVAAAPFIAAQALRDESNRWDNDVAQNTEYRTSEIANEIEFAADKLAPQ